MSYITIDDVREDLMDRQADDHLVLADLAFTDEDITYAMRACARKFNAIGPLVAAVCEDKLPINSMVFFDGIAWALIRRWRRNVAMNDLDYAAGGVTTNTQGNLHNNLMVLERELLQQFEEGAKVLKVHINVHNAFGEVG